MKNLIFIFLFLSLNAFGKPLSHPPQSHPALIGWSGIFATAFSNMRPLSPKIVKENEREFLLEDGTRIRGLLFLKDGPGPLVIANFGALSDRSSNGPSAIINKLFLARRLDAHVFVMDSASSAGFFVGNNTLTLGGYDEGRIIINLARTLKNSDIPLTGIHLLGVSLGGNSVLHALVEDKRLGTGLIKSAITFSAVIDQEDSIWSVLGTFGYPVEKTRKKNDLDWWGQTVLSSTLKNFNQTLSLLHLTPLKKKKAGVFFYNELARRLEFLRGQNLSHWNEAVSLNSVEEYIQTSSALLFPKIDPLAPVIVVHGHNDPVVPYNQFKKFQKAHWESPQVLTKGTFFGGHWGFTVTYGDQWMLDYLNRMIELGNPPEI